MIDLGTLGGANSVGTAINASGQVPGYDGIFGAPSHAFITNATSNAMTDLGTLGGTVSEGMGINASGEVTGSSNTAEDENTRGFLYSNGHMLDLNSLLSPTQAALYTITSGRSINDSGQIAAVGYINATQPPHILAFLLTPVSVFQCHGFQPPFDAPLALKQNNRVIPLKAQLFDSNNLRVDPAVLTALDAAPPVVNVSYSSGASPLVKETSLAESNGLSGTGYQLNFDRPGNWWFNLSSGLYTASGIYTVTLQSGDATKYQVSPQCSGTFTNRRSRPW